MGLAGREFTPSGALPQTLRAVPARPGRTRRGDAVSRFLGTYGFKIDKANQRVYLSAIFKEWYGNNFIRSYGTDKKFTDKKPVIRAALNFISNYVSREDADWLARKNYTVEFLKYDWTLNE